MEFLMNLGTELLAGVIGFVIGWASKSLRTLIRNRRAGRFWGSLLADNPQIVLGRAEGVSEPTGATSIGDAMGFAELRTHLKSLNLPDVDFKFDEYLQDEDLKPNLILIGGPGINKVTQQVLSMIAPELVFSSRTHLATVRDIKRDKEYRQVVDPDSKKVITDFAIILKTQNPFNPYNQVLLVAGISGFGTWAAVEYLVSKEFHKEFHKSPLASKQGSFECLVQTDVVLKRPYNVRRLELRPIAET